MHDIMVSVDPIGYTSKPKDGEIGKISKRVGENIKIIKGTKVFAEDVGKHGHTFSPATFYDGLRKKSNFQQLQFIALDIDGGLSFDDAKRRANKYDLPILFAYDTFSSIGHNKYRLVFLNNHSIDSYKTAEMMLNAFLTMFPEADNSCKDIAKMYFGGHNEELLYFDPNIPNINSDLLIAAVKQYMIDKYGKVNYRKKFIEFTKHNGIKLKNNRDPDIDISESLTQESSGASQMNLKMPKSIMYNNRFGKNEVNFSNTNGSCTSNNFVEDNGKRGRTPYRSSTMVDITANCQLYREFDNGDRRLHHSELFGLATNIFQVESGVKRFKKTITDHSYYNGSTGRWIDHFKDFKKGDYKPQCCTGFCPYAEACTHGVNILSTAKPKYHSMEKLANYEENFVSIDEVQKDLEQRMKMAVKADSYTIDIIKAQTAIGKSTTFIKLMKKYPNIKFLIAASSNDLKRELLDRAICEGVEIKGSPSLHELDLPEDVMEKIDNYYNTGQHRLVKSHIKKLIKHIDLRCAEKLENYLAELEEFNNSRCNAVTTHKKLMYKIGRAHV